MPDLCLRWLRRHPPSGRRRFARPALVALALAASAMPAAAYGPNLLSNPTFDADTSGWSAPTSSSINWAQPDVLGSPASGSLEAVIGTGHYNVHSTQCVAVTAGSSYELAGSIWLPPGSVPTQAEATVSFYTGSSCTGAPLGPKTSVFVAKERSVWSSPARLAVAPSGAGSALIDLSSVRGNPDASSPARAYFDDIVLRRGLCAPSATDLCLDGGRFGVEARWTTADSTSAFADAVPLEDDTGAFWFFEPSNLEMEVKVLDGCGITGHYWVFAAGLTAVKVDLFVRDEKAEITREYHDPQDEVFATITDTEAFDTCP